MIILMKTKRFNFRVSDTMDALIREKAKSAGMSITDYIILCAINNLGNVIDEETPVEDCTTKYYPAERKKNRGQVMGGM